MKKRGADRGQGRGGDRDRGEDRGEGRGSGQNENGSGGNGNGTHNGTHNGTEPVDSKIYRIVSQEAASLVSRPVRRITIEFFGGSELVVRRKRSIGDASGIGGGSSARQETKIDRQAGGGGGSVHLHLNEMQLAILEVLEGGERFDSESLARRAGYARRSLYRKRGGIRDLIDAGVVGKDEGGYYRVDKVDR